MWGCYEELLKKAKRLHEEDGLFIGDAHSKKNAALTESAAYDAEAVAITAALAVASMAALRFCFIFNSLNERKQISTTLLMTAWMPTRFRATLTTAINANHLKFYKGILLFPV